MSAQANGTYSSATTANTPLSSVLQTVGGMVVLKPGKDWGLQPGQSCGCIGNYVVQANITLNNFNANSITPTIYMMAINSGFFETQKGSSRVVKGVISEADVISAPLMEVSGTKAMQRAVGGSAHGTLSRLAHFVSRASPVIGKVLPHLTPLVSALTGGKHSGGKHSGGARAKLEDRLV